MKLSPQTARQARLLRLANKLARNKVPGCPTTEADKLLWVNSHLRLDEDRRLSHEEEALREKYIPGVAAASSYVSFGQESYGNLYHFRDFPMFPGEYVPPEHTTLTSIRDELNMDLTAQSLKEAWNRIAKSGFFQATEDYYQRSDGLEEEQLADIVTALFPSLTELEGRGVVRRVLESLSKPDNSPTRKLVRSITAEAVGLDQSPGHYSNFLEWMGRISDTKAFRTELSISEFCRRKFNRHDVRVMNENYRLLNDETLNQDKADGYSHFYNVLKDFSVKVASEDSRHQIGVRIDPAELDPTTGLTFGFGKHQHYNVIAVLRENTTKNGRVSFQGKPLNQVFRDQSWHMEQVLWPFDEASLDVREFDLYFMFEVNDSFGPELDLEALAPACRMAAAAAITKMLPVTRIPLKKAGHLSYDRWLPPGEHPGFLDGKYKRRLFRKR